MTLRTLVLSLFTAALTALALAGCVTPPEVRMSREPLPAQVATAGVPATTPSNEAPAAQLRRGDGVMLDTRAASAPPPNRRPGRNRQGRWRWSPAPTSTATS